MAKQKHRSLAVLERELHAHDAKRHSLIQEIKTAVESLAIGAAFTLGRIAQETGLGASLPENVPKKPRKKKRNVSPEVRAKLARLAKARWAAAKKAGKTRLG